MKLFLSIMVAMVIADHASAQERVSADEWVDLINRGNGVVATIAPDDVVDISEYRFSNQTSGIYYVNVLGVCVSARWWIDHRQNVIRFENPEFEPQDRIGFELHVDAEGGYFIQPDQPLLGVKPNQLRTYVVETLPGDTSGCAP